MLSVVLAQHDGRCDDLQQVASVRRRRNRPARRELPWCGRPHSSARGLHVLTTKASPPRGRAFLRALVVDARPRCASERAPSKVLGKDTRIRRCDYPKLTRFVKRIPTCSGHVCCIDVGEESEPHRGSFRRQATTTKVMGTSRGKRLAPLRTDDVANRAQNLAIWFVRKGSRSRRNHNPRWHGSTELLNAEEIERGGHDGDQ